MFSLDLHKAIKDSKDGKGINLDRVLELICSNSDIECEEHTGIYADHATLLRDVNDWARHQDIGIIGYVEFMTYMLDKHSISFTIPLHSKSKTYNYLDTICINLTDLARLGRLDPVIGRNKEIQTCIDIMLRRSKCNPVLIGAAGVGNLTM